MNKELQAETAADSSTTDAKLPSALLAQNPMLCVRQISFPHEKEFDEILIRNGFNKNKHGTYVLCHKETEYKFYLSENFAGCSVVWMGSPMPSIFHGMSVDNVDELNYLIKNVLVKIPTFLAKSP